MNLNIKKFVKISFIIILCPLFVYGQNFNYEIDSLHQELISNEYKDTALVDLLNNLSYAYQRNDREKILHYAQNALHLADSLDYLRGQATAYKNIGYYSYKMDQPIDTILQFLQPGLTIAKEINDYYLQAVGLNIIANKYSDEQQYGKCIEFRHQALDIHESKQPFNSYRLLLMGNLASTYYEIGDFSVAIEKFDEMFKYAEKIAPHYISYYNSFYAIALHKTGNSKQAIQILLKEAPYLKRIGDYEEVFYVFLYLSEIYLDLQSYEKAEEVIISAQEIATNYHLTDLECIPLDFHALILSKLGRHNEAVLKGEEAFNCFENTDYPATERLNMIENLLTVYNLASEPSKAAPLFEEYSKLLKEKYDLDQRKIMTKSELARSKRENQLLKEIQLKDKITIDNQKYITVFLILIATLLLGLLYSFYKANRNKKQMTQILEQRVKERTKELNELNLELSISNEELKRFAYIASHDLKEPLISMIGFIDLLQNEIQDQLEEEPKKILDFIVKGGKQMRHIIENILEYSSLNTETTEFVEIDTNIIIKDVRLLLSSLIEKQNGVVNIEGHLPKLNYNKQRVLMLFNNLIDNGLKYNNSETPTITISYKTEGEKGIFLFKDNGIGIEEEYLELIFVMFKRLHPYSAYQGAGIGLSYCKKIVEKMGGEIKLFSEQGKGSEFHIIIPSSMILG